MTPTEEHEWYKRHAAYKASVKIPQWQGMPKEIVMSSIRWEDVYKQTHEEIGREPTKEEITNILETIKGNRQDDKERIPEMGVVEDIHHAVSVMLRSKSYNQDTMTDSELTANKYCHQCNKMRKTFWELAHCEKNPEGKNTLEIHHGNNEACDDVYCNPERRQVSGKQLTAEYVKTHQVSEKCTECGQYLESSSPQIKDSGC